SSRQRAIRLQLARTRAWLTLQRGLKTRSLPFVSFCLLALAACSHAQPSPDPVPAQVVAEAPPPARVPAPAAAPEPTPDVAPASIYFDFDASELSDSARAALQSF